MIKEHFDYPRLKYDMPHAVSEIPKNLYVQERDWTCAIACFRSIVDSDIAEPNFIQQNSIMRGPHYTTEMKTKEWPHPNFEVKYAEGDVSDLDPSVVWQHLYEHWRVMLETDLNGGHWMIVLALVPTQNSWDAVVWDPYYGRARVFDLPELLCMCHDYAFARRL